MERGGSNLREKARKRLAALTCQPAGNPWECGTPGHEVKDLKEAMEELAVQHVELEMQAEELRESQRQLEEAKQFYQEFFQWSPVPMLRVTMDGEVREMNMAARHVLLRGPFEQCRDWTQALRGWLSPRMRRVWEDFLREVTEKGEGGGVELMLQCAGQEERYFSVSGRRMAGCCDAVVYLNETTALRREREEFALLATVAAHPGQSAVFTDERRRVTWVNDGFTKLTGYTLEEVKGRTLSLLQGPDTDPATVERMRARLDAGEGFTEEILNYTKDGQRYWVQLQVLPRRDGQGKLVGFVSVQTDVTHFREREEELRQLRQAIEQSPVGVLITDKNGLVRFANPACEKITGYRVEELRGQLPPLLREEHPKAREVWAALHSEQTWSGPAQTKGKAGEVYYEHVTAAPVLDERGRLIGFVVIKIDVTEHVVLRRELERLSEVARRTVNPVVFADAEGRIVWVNEAYEVLTGWRLEEVKGRKPSFVQGPGTDRATVERMRGAQREGRGFVEEVLNYRKDGTPYWVRLEVTPQRDEEGRVVGWFSVQTDITALREREEELARAREAAERASAAKGQFLATMSHEIRTPLNAVLGIADLLLKTRLDRRQRKLTQALKHNGAALLGLINDVLDLAKIEAGKLELQEEGFDLRRMVEDLALGYELRAEEKGLVFRHVVEEGVPSWVVGDRVRLVQVLQNLCGNALKFTEKGSVSLSVERGDVEEEGRVGVRFVVRDTGIGIAPEKLGQLFERFTQADAGVNRRYGGTGLGLAICRELVELMGGKIGATSRPGEGSEFWFLVPLGLGEREGSEGEAEGAPREARFEGRVLLVEDYPANQMVAEEFLRECGVEVVVASGGEEALGMLAGEDFDVVLMDVQMPGMDGWEATRLVREGARGVRNPRVPIVAMTAHALREDRERCLAAGMDDYLSKPVSLDGLRRVLGRFLPVREGDAGGGEAAVEMEPIFDRADMLRMLGGSEEFARTFTRQTLPQVDELLEQLRRDWGAAPEQAREHLHKLKSLGGYFGCYALARAVEDCRRAVREDGVGNDGPLVCLENVWRQLRQELEEVWL